MPAARGCWLRNSGTATRADGSEFQLGKPGWVRTMYAQRPNWSGSLGDVNIWFSISTTET
jgi:hypothetical protein